ncbi:MAG: prolyl oligopeptidase family serine peptidase [Planctomycetes bacterium]|nr:prolyl oligopeptidase family serine peptidase [Planctomycetota bacterium]
MRWFHRNHAGAATLGDRQISELSDLSPGRRKNCWLAFFALLGLGLVSGCAVPQPRGAGTLERVVEPTTSRGYWRYLPKTYVASSSSERSTRRWPVVVTFHGMKPFDNAHPQALEWEAEADRYGFVVVAPELRAPDVLGEFPVRRVHPAFKQDEDAVLAILDHLFASTQADPANVLSTSWSSGGYMAHYMLNRHPDRFNCLAVRQSNFSSSVLDTGIASRSVNHPVLILNTQNDFAICVAESREARAWYQKAGYHNLAWVVIRSLGHERTPDLAADFFAHVAGVEPLTPPTVLVSRQAIDGNDEGVAFLSGKMSFAGNTGRSATSGAPVTLAAASERPKAGSSGGSPTATVSTKPIPQRTATPPRPTPITASSSGGPGSAEPPPAMTVRGLPSGQAPDYSGVRQLPNSPPARSSPPRLADYPDLGSTAAKPQANATPTRAAAVPSRPTVPRKDPLSIRVSSAIGIEPLHLNYSAECPLDWYNSASFSWTLGGETIGSGVNGQRTIASAGEHLLSLLVVTADGQEYRSSRLIRVIPKLNAAAASGSKP